jgi:hypothetical protein
MSDKTFDHYLKNDKYVAIMASIPPLSSDGVLAREIAKDVRDYERIRCTAYVVITLIDRLRRLGVDIRTDGDDRVVANWTDEQKNAIATRFRAKWLAT